MGHVTKRTVWCDIDIDTTLGQIFLQERWQYEWLAPPPMSPWTYKEQYAFHHGADRSIWGIWSNRTRLDVQGRSEFARRFAHQGVTIHLDIEWVLRNPHWNVKVTKIAKGRQLTSSTDWIAHTLELDSEDLRLRADIDQIPVTHEFGHAVGNSKFSHAAHGDEYAAGSAYQYDSQSIMHSGSQLRKRHFDTIIEQLDTMIPSTKFLATGIL